VCHADFSMKPSIGWKQESRSLQAQIKKQIERHSQDPTALT